jgi:ATP synthase protein I
MKYTDYHSVMGGPPPASGPDRDRPDSTLQRAARARLDVARTFGAVGTLGLSVVIALVLGTALGLWLDRVTGWSPVCFIVGFLLGLAAGILNIYRTMSRLPK